MVKIKPPYTFRYDMVGVVDKPGPGAKKLAMGHGVADLTVTGFHVEHICLPAEQLGIGLDSTDASETTSQIHSYSTAYQMLHTVAQVKPGEKILVHGAGDAVISALLQLRRFWI